MAVCYRHPDRETGVSCSNCGRPICTDCMTATSVGMRCPECSKQKTKVRHMRTTPDVPQATYALIAVNVLAYVAMTTTGGGINGGGGTIFIHGALFGPAVADGEYWRLITGGFLHAGILHLLLNMVSLYFLGALIEPALGRARFVALYGVGLVGGAAGALLLDPTAATVGASGAIFGLFGGAIVLLRERGIPIMQSGIGVILILNLVLSFRPGISLGGHLGGLLAGVLAAFVLVQLGERRSQGELAVAACAGLAVVFAVAGVVFAGQPAGLGQ
jgi:membrane associated rhomboid family serine protease